MTQPLRTYLPWALAAIVSTLATVTWGQSFAWNWDAMSPYLFFPVLGLLAFSLMWTHYMVGAVKYTLLGGVDLAMYFRYTGYVVLAALVFHPGILVYQLWHDGFGLPPGSYTAIVGRGMEWVALLGTASLFAFLAFEFKRWFGAKPWWKYVNSASDVAMLAVFYHGLRLGSQLQGGWFQGVWLFYGIMLVAVLVYKYVLVVRRKLATTKA